MKIMWLTSYPQSPLLFLTDYTWDSTYEVCTCVLHSIGKPNMGIFPGKNLFHPSKRQKLKWSCGGSSPDYNSASLICQTSVDTSNKPETTGYFSFHNISTFQTLSRFKILNCWISKEVISPILGFLTFLRLINQSRSTAQLLKSPK